MKFVSTRSFLWTQRAAQDYEDALLLPELNDAKAKNMLLTFFTFLLTTSAKILEFIREINNRMFGDKENRRNKLDEIKF